MQLSLELSHGDDFSRENRAMVCIGRFVRGEMIGIVKVIRNVVLFQQTHCIKNNYFCRFNKNACFLSILSRDKLITMKKHWKRIIGFTLAGLLLALIIINKDGFMKKDADRSSFVTGKQIFILPPSQFDLRQRLSNRGTDSVEVIEHRLSCAVEDMQQYVNFDFVIINDDFNKALHDLEAVIIANRLALKQQAERHQDLIQKLITPTSVL